MAITRLEGSRGLSHGMETGKGGKGEGEGGLFLSLGNLQGAWLRLALGIFVGSGCFLGFLGEGDEFVRHLRFDIAIVL